MAIEFENRSKKVLVNKAFDGGHAGPTQWITVPHGTTAELAEQKRRVGSLAWNDDLDQLVVDDGSGFVAAGGGGTPTGDPDTVAFFDNAGNLDSNPDFRYDQTSGTLVVGREVDTGTFSPGGQGSILFGTADGVDANITLDDNNSLIGGLAQNGGTITNLASGTVVIGVSLGTDSEISSDQRGSLIHGLATDGGEISAGISAEGAQAFGFSRGVGTAIYASAPGAHAWGQADGAASEIEASGQGSEAFGLATNAGSIIASQSGALAHGFADTIPITASGMASHAHGTGTITASGIASHAHGTGNINAVGHASHSYGVEGSFSGGNIISNGAGSEAAGQINNGANNSIEANGPGSKAFGGLLTQGLNHIVANGSGSIAHGLNNCYQANLIANGDGSFAGGYMDGGFPGNIAADGPGSMARGYSTGGVSIHTAGGGSIASGRAVDGNIRAEADGAVAIGVISDSGNDHAAVRQGSAVFGGSNSVGGDYSAAFGRGHTSGSFAAFMIGQYGDVGAEDPDSWVDTDTAFVVGNGTSVGARNNALRITKAGHVCANGAQSTVDPGGDAGAGAVAIANTSATDKAGRVRVTTGTGSTSGQLIEITFATPYANAPSVNITAESANARNLTALGVESVNNVGFVIAAAGVADATEYDFNYQVIGLE